MPRFVIAISFVLLIAGGYVAGTARADTDAKRAKVDMLLVVSGTAETTTQMVRTLLPQFLGMLRQAFPGAPPAVMQAFDEEIKRELQAATPELIDEMAALYARNFTREEVEAMIAFWQTPAGRKMAQLLPRITQESLVLGQSWGQRGAIRAFGRLQERAQLGTL